jgi:hypothetical protein
VEPPHTRGVPGGRPPGLAHLRGPGPALIDESDDADGHRIYFNPWAADAEDEQDEAD